MTMTTTESLIVTHREENAMGLRLRLGAQVPPSESGHTTATTATTNIVSTPSYSISCARLPPNSRNNNDLLNK